MDTKKRFKNNIIYNFYSILSDLANHEVLENPLTNTKLIIAMSLIRIFNDGPEVSFKGSPIVSPITAA